nr:hypothetical protein GCM10020092_023960 [Actinoplanes digitatis]
MSAARVLMLSSELHPEAVERMTRSRQSLLAALTAVIEPDAGQLRRSPGAVARLLLLFCGANTFGPFGDPRRFDGGEIVSLLLDGLLVIPAKPQSRGDPADRRTPRPHSRGVPERCLSDCYVRSYGRTGSRSLWSCSSSSSPRWPCSTCPP